MLDLKSLTRPQLPPRKLPQRKLSQRKLPPSPANGAGAAVQAAQAAPAVQAVQVTLQLDDELRERLERQRQIVASSQAAREFGVTVNIAMVTRIALIRGLERMEGGRGAGSGADNAVGGMDSGDPADQAHGGPPAGERLEVDYNEEGEIAPPEGWNKWNGQERIPSEQQEVHDYYIGQGLWRWWGKSGDQIFTFYWSPKESMSDVSVYESADPNGKKVALQQTPWGPGHILPKSWGLTPG